MNKEIWEIWIEDRKRREQDLMNYLKSKRIKKEIELKELVSGHLEKAEHNLKFAMAILEMQEFNDWAIVTSYYAIYHAALALCASKGYSTKDHNATLLILINEFYSKGLVKEEIEMVRDSTLEKEEVLYYVEARIKRKRASYSTQKIFNKEEAESLRQKAISFIIKAQDITESNKIK